MPKYLSKSRFKIGRECPTKLYYHNNKKTYADNSVDDPFLTALAEGGFQVGELAKLYYPEGFDIKTLDHQSALAETKETLSRSPICIYEPAFLHDHLFVRVDVLHQNKSTIELIEVKSKSFDLNIENPFWQKSALKKGMYKLDSSWKPYLYDVAFQTYVVSKVHPDWKVKPFLMLADKTAKTSIDGLNQMFRIRRENGRTEGYPIEGININDLGDPVLIKVDVSEVVTKIINNEIELTEEEKPFLEEVEFLRDILINNSKVEGKLGTKCKTCQFKCDEVSESLKSGFHECWQNVERKEHELNGPFVYDIWNFRKAGKLIDSGVYLAREISEEDVSPTQNSDKPGFSNTERQWEQIQSIKANSQNPTLLKSELKREMSSWQYPLHFIDFETSMVALPFNKGRTPYEQIAFQFSHHVFHENGKIEHVGEYLNRQKGHFPNFDFVRDLKKQLSNNDGTIFRYAAHENTVLCQIYDQLIQSNESDKEELCQWITTITKSPKTTLRHGWEGERNMVDLCEIVKQFYYDPAMGGSNSIKKVLPAILKSSELLQNKYSKAIYGTPVYIPAQIDHRFQFIAITDSSLNRSPIPITADH